MKFPTFIKSVSPKEAVLFVIFVLYIIFPVNTPAWFAPYVDSALGMVFMFCVTVALFLYTNPILGVLYIFVAYELLRRSANVTGRAAIIQYTPTQVKKDVEIKAMNTPTYTTLEEVVIAERAPIGVSDPIKFVDSGFKPIADKVVGASMF
jgi:hypothetical protein